MDNNAFAVIMAGGRGERFWPESRIAHPKQLLRLLDGITMIEQTVRRIAPLFPPERIVIATNERYVPAMRALFADIPPENILGEPAARNTAPCIAMAAAYVGTLAKDRDPVIAVFPSDHAIQDAASFRSVVADCTAFARSRECIVTIGIAPTFPATGYGYIQTGARLDFPADSVFFNAVAFREKPDPETAKAYLESGNFRWNGGMFFFSAGTLMNAFALHAPFLADFCNTAAGAFRARDNAALAAAYCSVQKISIDYAIMEKAHNVVVAEASFDWDDVGSWTSLRNQIPPDENRNVVRARHAGIDTGDCIVFSDDDSHLIATAGLHDTIVVHTADATLVCSDSYAQKIGQLLKLMDADPDLKKYL